MRFRVQEKSAAHILDQIIGVEPRLQACGVHKLRTSFCGGPYPDYSILAYIRGTSGNAHNI